ncbi:lipase [Thiosulfatimonas sediminis]|uniref:Lipase n=1 Tax=Thiosulfatimonas sediminis TaxID=2675054 RepID=A0A6F8PTI4_9GAMM|nr:hypothetical protein [Thiosulfatimonas sediminis]BBP45318.1 lipase [Thiosulfatimonas sediminis]
MLVTSFSRFKKGALATALLTGTMLLGGCGGGTDQDITLDTVKAETANFVVMNFALSDIPFPHDALFSGSKDGTLNIPVDDPANYADPRVAMNAIDGFSTSAPITFKVNALLDMSDAQSNQIPDVLEAGINLYQLTLGQAGYEVSKKLVLGVDYIPAVTAASSSQTNIAIVPLKPLASKSTYVVTVDNDMLDSEQQPLAKSFFYKALSGSESLVGTAYAELEPLRQLTRAQLAAIGEDDINALWSFTTQSIGEVLHTLSEQVAEAANTSLILGNAGVDTSAFQGAGLAQIYAGTLKLPYYGAAPSQTNPIAPLNTFWKGVGDSLLTQYNPNPTVNFTQTVPVLMSVPKADLPDGSNGWPVVIFQHGITQNRGNLLTIADRLAAAGFAAVAIDLPLHGITPQSALAALRIQDVSERTFDVNYVSEDENGNVTAAAPDASVDSSGRHFINLSHLVVTRDNLRQAVADLMQLRSAIENWNSNGLLDSTQISFVGHSLGAMVGGIYQSIEPADEAVYAMPGLQMAYLLSGSSNYAPEIAAGLAANGIQVPSAEYQQFLLAAQTVVETADPLNYVTELTNPTLLFEVVGDGGDNLPDQTIPNSVPMAPLAGTNPWIRLQGLNELTGSGAVEGQLGVMKFTDGYHGSILIPSDEDDQLVTQTMQEAMASFLATGGTSVSVSDDSTIK